MNSNKIHEFFLILNASKNLNSHWKPYINLLRAVIGLISENERKTFSSLIVFWVSVTSCVRICAWGEYYTLNKRLKIRKPSSPENNYNKYRNKKKKIKLSVSRVWMWMCILRLLLFSSHSTSYNRNSLFYLSQKEYT